MVIMVMILMMVVTGADYAEADGDEIYCTATKTKVNKWNYTQCFGQAVFAEAEHRERTYGTHLNWELLL